MRDNKWVRLLAYVTGLVNYCLLLQNEYLIAENRILRSHLPPRVRLSNPKRSTVVHKNFLCVARCWSSVSRIRYLHRGTHPVRPAEALCLLLLLGLSRAPAPDSS